MVLKQQQQYIFYKNLFKISNVKKKQQYNNTAKYSTELLN